MQYTIKKPHGEGQNEFDTVIEITGLRTEVTVNGLLDHLEGTVKTMKEQAGQIVSNKFLMEKAIEELPLLKEVPENKVALAFSYFSKMSANKIAEETIKTCEETISIYRGHLEEIEKQTGIKCLPVVSPIQQAEIPKENE